ncbi:hypothetical protein MVUOKPPV_CDS0117 [Klebsiella phage phi1_175008]|uniref:Uncharacterized protein n=2 Tax=Klebsiella phage phi1_175008 TaxID=3127744 RepID=A0AC61ZT79_9CAUD
MITLTGWVVVATLNGKSEIDNSHVYKTPGECYVALHWPTTEGDKTKYQCFYIEGKPVEFEVKVLESK